MQFHLNGFRAGDPSVSDPTATRPATNGSADAVDVLIVGCGPAGLTLAAQLAAFPEISTRIVEQKSGPMEKGQADGVSVRSMEMFQAFGFADRVMKEAYQVNEVTFWKPDPNRPEHIKRFDRVQDVEDGLSEMPHVIQNQGRIHDMYLDLMRNSPTGLVPEYDTTVVDLKVVPDKDRPVEVTIEKSGSGDEARTETVRARYVVGCDGARSTVRRAIGRELHGDSVHQAWGVMDLLAVTNFPDIRLKSIIQSQDQGNLLLIPREGGHLFRMYVEMDKLNADERVANRKIAIDDLIAAANRILAPYAIDVKQVVWWSVYEIGHRLADKFDDVPEDAVGNRLPHVFIAGDACHTHSPKAGQGMNVSMGDAFNLGWKLVSVLTGRSQPELLHSYSAERKAVAKALIDFDHEWSGIIGAPPERGESDSDRASRLQKHFVAHGRYTAGVSVRYEPSDLTSDGSWQHLAKGFDIGTRLHSAPVIRLADAHPMHLGHTIEADTRWRIFAFSGPQHPAAKDAPVQALCDFLEHAPESPLRRHRRPGEDIDAVIDFRAVFQQHHRELDLEQLPGLLLPAKGKFGLQDREKAFCANQADGRDIFRVRYIDRDNGCLLIVRPDQHVATVLPLTAHQDLTNFFGKIFV